jgi:hypothetical protein
MPTVTYFVHVCMNRDSAAFRQPGDWSRASTPSRELKTGHKT